MQTMALYAQVVNTSAGMVLVYFNQLQALNLFNQLRHSHALLFQVVLRSFLFDVGTDLVLMLRFRHALRIQVVQAEHPDVKTELAGSKDRAHNMLDAPQARLIIVPMPLLNVSRIRQHAQPTLLIRKFALPIVIEMARRGHSKLQSILHVPLELMLLLTLTWRR